MILGNDVGVGDWDASCSRDITLLAAVVVLMIAVAAGWEMVVGAKWVIDLW